MPVTKVIRVSKRRGGRRKKMVKSYGKLMKYSSNLSFKNMPHHFKRLGKKTIIYVTGAGTIGWSPATGSSQDTGLNISSVYADQLTGCYQFGWSHNFQLNNVVGNSDFINLFDRYRITGVKYRIMYQCNMAAVQTTAVLPIMHYVRDEDDSTAPTDLSDINQKELCKVKILGATTMVSYYIKPKVASDVYQGVASTGYAVKSAPYINSSFPTVQHYGIKVWLNQIYAVAANNTAITIEPVYYLSCRDPQ